MGILGEAIWGFGQLLRLAHDQNGFAYVSSIALSHSFLRFSSSDCLGFFSGFCWSSWWASKRLRWVSSSSCSSSSRRRDMLRRIASGSYAGGAASAARGELCAFFLSFDRLLAMASGSNRCFGNCDAMSSMSK